MFPYRFDASPPSGPPAAEPPPPRAAHRRSRRGGAAALLAVALTGSTVGGGIIGAATAARWAPAATAIPAVTEQPVAAQPNAAQPIAAQPAQTANLVGDVYAKVSPAVVQVVVSGQTPASTGRSGSGSGFVVDASGLILTNNHVVDAARAVSVRFKNGATREARVLGTDRGNDLAVLKVDLPDDVPVAQLGESDEVQVGETAIAIGSPFGLDQTVTQGIVSATNRTWQPGNGRVRRNLLQTDAPINPGNSGGPLLNARGEVIGINSMIESPVRGSVGVGFAIPVNTAKRLLPQLEAGARLEPVWLGIAGQELDQTIARDQGLAVQAGVLITNVVPNSPAARAGLRGGQGANERIPRGGDVITAIEGTAIKDMLQLTEQLSGRKPGDGVRLTILRDGRQRDVSVTLQAWPQESGQ